MHVLNLNLMINSKTILSGLSSYISILLSIFHNIAVKVIYTTISIKLV